MTHALEVLTIVLGLATVPLLLMDRSGASDGARQAASVGGWVIWTWFVLELMFVVWLAEQRAAALRAHWFDVLVTIGCFPVLFVGLGSLRILRAARILRPVAVSGKLIGAGRRIGSTDGLIYAAMLTTILIVGGGYAATLLERKTFPDMATGVWWSLVTVSTIGYGDIVPHTTAGRILAGVLMFAGIGFLAVLTASIASKFVGVDNDDEQADMRSELAEIKDTLREIERHLNIVSGSGCSEPE